MCLQVCGEYFEGDVVVVELVVAEGDVAIEREVVAVVAGLQPMGIHKNPTVGKESHTPKIAYGSTRVARCSDTTRVYTCAGQRVHQRCTKQRHTRSAQLWRTPDIG